MSIRWAWSRRVLSSNFDRLLLAEPRREADVANRALRVHSRPVAVILSADSRMPYYSALGVRRVDTVLMVCRRSGPAAERGRAH